MPSKTAVVSATTKENYDYKYDYPTTIIFAKQITAHIIHLFSVLLYNMQKSKKVLKLSEKRKYI